MPVGKFSADFNDVLAHGCERKRHEDDCRAAIDASGQTAPDEVVPAASIVFEGFATKSGTGRREPPRLSVAIAEANAMRMHRESDTPSTIMALDLLAAHLGDSRRAR